MICEGSLASSRSTSKNAASFDKGTFLVGLLQPCKDLPDRVATGARPNCSHDIRGSATMRAKIAAVAFGGES